METRRAKLQQQQQQQQQKVSEKQSPWVLATPAMPVTPEKRTGFSDRPRDLRSTEMATSSRSNEAANHNIGSYRTILANPTTGFPQVHFGNVLVLTDPAAMQNIASFAPAVIVPIVGSNDQTLLPLNGNLLLSGSVCNGGNHSQDGATFGYRPNLSFVTDEAARTSTTGAVPLLLAPVTPAKGKQINDPRQQEMNKAVEKELILKGGKKEDGQIQCSETVHHDSSKLVSPITPDKGKTLEDNPREVINPVDVGLTRDGNMQEWDQSSGHSAFKRGTCSQEQGVELPTHTSFSSYTDHLNIVQDEERIDQGRNLSSTRKKKATRKKHRPKVLKDGLLASKKPVTPKPVTPKQVRKKDNQTGKRSYVRKKKSSNCPNTTPDTTRDINEDSSAVRKSPNQHTENGTKFVRRRLHFESESQSVDEHLEQAFTKSEPQERGRCADTATSSRARLTVQLGQGMEVEVEESEAGIAFDLNRSLNQMLDDYIRLPENPTLPLQPSRRELLKKNWKDLARKAGNANSIDNTNFVGVSKLQNTQSQMKIDGDTDMILIQDDEDHKQTKSNHSHVDNAQSGYTYPTSSDKYFMQPQVCDSPHFPQECKRRRTGTEHDRGEFGQMTRNDSRLLSSADEQKVVSTNKLQAPDFMLAFGPTKGATKKRSKTPIRAHKSAFNVIVTGCDQPLETHESGHHAFLEALFADTHTCMKTGKPTRKKQVHTKSILNIDREHEPVHFLGQKLVGLPSTSEDFHDLQIIPIQECQRRSNILEPFCTNLMSQAIVPYIDPADNYMDAAAKPQHSLVSYGSSMIVPYTGTYGEIKKKCPRAKVDLDDETNRVWKLLMGKMVPDAQEGSDVDKEEMWEEQRKVFRGRADSFIARMSLIQGDRQFSPWKGSVLDSVIGVFLTQNVSDHLSSSAFMALAAKFPLNPRKDDVEKRMCTMTEGYGSLPSSGKAHCQEQVLCQKECELGSSITYHTGDVEENKMDKANESTRMNTKASDSFGGVVINLRRRESGVSPETPGDRTQISTTITMNSESEDKRSLDDAVSSQNSVSSSDGSSNCLSQKTNSVGSGPHTHLDTDQRNGAMVSDLDGYALCQKHIQISGANIMQEIYNHDNDENMLSEQCGTVDQKSEKKIGLTDGLQSLRYSCQEISCAANLQLNFSQQDSTGMPSVVSESSDSDNMENADVIRMQSTSSLLFPDPWTTKTDNIMVHRNCKESSKNSSESESQQSSPLMSNVTMSLDACLAVSKQSLKSLTFTNEDEATTKFQQSERNQDCQARKTQHEDEYSFQKQHCQPQEAFSNSCDDVKGTLEVFDVVEPNSKVEVCSPLEPETETSKGTPRSKKTKAESEKEKNFDWDSLRKEACHNGYKSERSQDRMDSMDWEAIRHSDIREISETIRERGMNNVLAGRIKDFLNRLVGDHGSLDLEWLRDVPPDKAKEYLLSIRGLGLKSVECVRLLTLHQHAFPVDTNVGRICVRLGWVPLQPLPEYLQLHLLETYPVLATIQKYLWPRLCTLDQRTLYELHYQMITFGKVFCTKSKPNCNACPMRGECRHFASAFASARLALPGPEERRLVKSTFPSAPENPPTTIFDPMPPCQIGDSCFLQGIRNTNEPIIEEPPSPEPECQGALAREIEEAFYEDPYEIPTTDLNLEDFTLNLQNYMQENMELQDGDIEKALVAITREAASIPVPKLKNVSRLRTEHQVYELPDAHPLLEGLEPREYDDPCPYLLSIWAPGETARSTKPPETCCSSPEMDNICEDMTCFACSCRREEQAQTVRGTLLIPCRTANRGSFPLNGTYFQVNEVFADHQSSHSPLIVPRRLIWNLPRRIVYFGTSIPTLFRGLTIDEIQLCFSRGFVCLRGFDRKTRAPRPLSPRLHLAASHAPKEKKTSDKDEKKASQKTARKS